MECIFWFIAVMDLAGICLVLWVRRRMEAGHGLPDIDPEYIPPMPKCKPAKRCQFISGQFVAVDKINPGDMIFIEAEESLADAVIRIMWACRVCGCTDNECSQCVEATGQPCHWVEPDLCSRCADEIYAAADAAAEVHETRVPGDFNIPGPEAAR